MNSLAVNSEPLSNLCHEIGDSRRLIVASNRGPVEHHVSEDGSLSATRGGGGVAIALSALNKYVDSTWVACAMGDGDRYAAHKADHRTIETFVDGDRHSLRYVLLPRETYDKHYSVFCNPFLWFFQHNMWDHLYDPAIDHEVWDAWEDGYVPANECFAQTVVAEASREDLPLIMLHDYHLYLTPGLVRSQLPYAVLQHFTHIPWPPPKRWMLLPRPVCRTILESLCSCDIVGLQTKRDVHNFLLTCETYLREARVDHEMQTVRLNGRETKVNAYPISVDVAGLEKLANSWEVKDHERRLHSLLGKKTIMRVDRVDLSKNIIRGFEAYDMLLARHPELIGQVNFLAFLVPSRTNIREYQEYTREVFGLVDRINMKYGREGWRPITVFYEHNYPQAIAGMRLYDVLLVNALADGMNLVAKEGPIVNGRDGVLILSQKAGAHEQLRDGAVSIVPEDVEGTARALYEALFMPPEERRMRVKIMRERISEEDIGHWFWGQLNDLQRVARWSSLQPSYRHYSTPLAMPRQQTLAIP